MLKWHEAPEEVSRLRYNMGVVRFAIPVLIGWVSLYTADYIPGFIEPALLSAVGGMNSF